MNVFRKFAPVFIAVIFILSDYQFSYLYGVRQAIATAFSPLYFVVNLPSELYIWINEQGSDKASLLKKNKQLTRNIGKLHAKLQTYNALLLENQKLSKLLGASYTLKNQTFILARISAIKQSRLNKQIVINKGSNDGIKINQIALGNAGVVGQITQVTPFYSTLLIISDPTQHVPVKSQRNGIRGISKGVATWKNELTVNFIQVDSDVVVGDVFSSSAISSKFPAGYPVGTVISVEKQINNPFLQIRLTPIQRIDRLEFVLIVTRPQ